MPVFENGWICRECWSANREQDARCYRCKAVPKRREMPEPSTFSTPAAKPDEERKKVTNLTGPAPAPAVQASTPVAPPVATEPSPPREFPMLVRLRAVIAAIALFVGRVVGVARAVPGAPRAAGRFVNREVRAGVDAAMSPVRAVLAHRRAWLTAAWLVSGFTSALLFSVALHANLATSLLVVASVAIFSGLSAAITTATSERRDRRAGDALQRVDVRAPEVLAPTEHAAPPAPVLGTPAGR
jgi:hypothetical protein